MLERAAVVTGSSSGFGLALAQFLVQKGFYVFGIARRGATFTDPNYQHVQADLTESWPKALLDAIRAAAEAERLILINNAGMMSPIAGIAEIAWPEWQEHHKLNLEVPLRLVQSLIRGFQGQSLHLVHVSSGASARPYAGWGAYCCAKAALNMGMRVVSEELKGQASWQQRFNVFEYQPGPLNTAMQEVVREASSIYFYQKARFEDLFAAHKLHRPELVAQDCLERLLKLPLDGGYHEARYGSS